MVTLPRISNKATNRAIDARIQDFNQVSRAVTNYSTNSTLQGSAYDESKKYMNFFIYPYTEGL